MKQYDKIYFELDPFYPSICPRLTTGEKIGIHSGPLICMTIEELSDLWNAAALAMDEVNAHEYEYDYVPKRPGFEEYLQIKGISI